MPQAAVLTGHVVQRSSFGNTEKGRPWQAWVVATVMLAVLVMLITEARPPDVVMFVALAFVWNLGIITTMEALEGFSNSSLVVVGSMFVVVKAVDRSKLIDRTARATLGDKTSEFGSLCRLCCITLFFGCFINNAPLVALFMPIVRDWARARDFAPSKFLMPLSYASIGGGVLTMIGTSTNLVINGMMQDQTGEAFGFFDPARVGIFQNIFTLCYMLSLGVRLLPESKGGLFRTLKERKQDMVTELQIPQNFPLTGSCVMEVMDALGVPREALLKIFRQPRKGCFTRTISGSGEGELQSHATTLPNLVRMKSSPDIRPLGLSYNERTAHCWGHLQKRRRSMTSGNIPSGGWRPVESHRPRSVTAGDVGASEAEGEGCSRPIDMDDPDVREIFPVADHEVLFGGDVLLLSLPRDACVAFVNSPRVAELLRGFGPDPSQEDGCAAGPKEVGLRICDVDLLDIPGRQNEFVELVISRSNPFVGTDFSGTARHEFEERYQVAVLAVRHRQWEAAEDSKRDHLLSLAHQQNATSLGDSPMGVIEEAPAEPQALQQPASSISSSWLLGASSFRGADPRVAKKLKPGDAVLVLARASDQFHTLATQDFLAQTTVAHEPDFTPTAFDYVPLLLFVIGLVLVASQQVMMVQMSMALAAIYLIFGWVSAKEVRESIDWNMLILIGSALGLAKAVQASKLSGAVAFAVKNSNVGKRGMVFILYFFSMLITELVTNNAAAALAFPLAADISREMGLNSTKPLAMTVMLATSACYANPIGSPPNLMVMGPGGYTFRDFFKVGVGMDIICWLTAGIFVPIMWPMQ